MEIDAFVDRLAREQYGAFAHWQLVGARFAPSTIARARRRGRWQPLDHGVHAHPSHRSTWEQRAMASTLSKSLGDLAGRSAAALWRTGDLPRRGRICLVVPPGRHRGSRLAAVSRSAHRETRRHEGIRVSSPQLTVVQLAPLLDERRLGRVVDDAVSMGLCRVDHIGNWAVRAGASRLPGIGTLRAVLRERGEGFVPAESELEARMFEMLDAPGIPRVIRQAPLPWRPELPNRVDGLLDGWPILVEGDGRSWHHRLEQMAVDRTRDRDAVAHGVIPLRFSWIDVTERVEECRAQVRAAGATWAPPQGRPGAR